MDTISSGTSEQPTPTQSPRTSTMQLKEESDAPKQGPSNISSPPGLSSPSLRGKSANTKNMDSLLRSLLLFKSFTAGAVDDIASSSGSLKQMPGSTETQASGTVSPGQTEEKPDMSKQVPARTFTETFSPSGLNNESVNKVRKTGVQVIDLIAEYGIIDGQLTGYYNATCLLEKEARQKHKEFHQLHNVSSYLHQKFVELWSRFPPAPQGEEDDDERKTRQENYDTISREMGVLLSKMQILINEIQALQYRSHLEMDKCKVAADYFAGIALPQYSCSCGLDHSNTSMEEEVGGMGNKDRKGKGKMKAEDDVEHSSSAMSDLDLSEMLALLKDMRALTSNFK